MKTLVNIDNPVVRITAPEIQVRSDSYYFLINENYGFIIPKARWTLVEEEVKSQEVDLEKEIEKAQEHYFALKDKGFSLDSMDVSVLARHFYELGRIAQIEQNNAFADMHKSPKEKEE